MSDKPIDHRTRVGIERREKMRRRLVESAFKVFSEKGVDASVIDDVKKEAGVSRGTFYNYFKTNNELLAAVGSDLSNELINCIESIVGDYDDPIKRLSTGLRLFLRTAEKYPLLAQFFWRAGFNSISTDHLMFIYLPKHIDAGIKSGEIKSKDIMTALEVLAGISLSAMFAFSNRKPGEGYPEEMVKHILLGLGIPKRKITSCISIELPEISFPEDSLLTRSHRS